MSASGLTAYCFKSQTWDNDYYYAVAKPLYTDNKISQIHLTKKDVTDIYISFDQNKIDEANRRVIDYLNKN